MIKIISAAQSTLLWFFVTISLDTQCRFGYQEILIAFNGSHHVSEIWMFLFIINKGKLFLKEMLVWEHQISSQANDQANKSTS